MKRAIYAMINKEIKYKFLIECVKMNKRQADVLQDILSDWLKERGNKNV